MTANTAELDMAGLPDSGLVNAAQLRAWYGAKRDTDVVRCLERDRIRFSRGVGGAPCTTVEAINRALLGVAVDADEFDFRVAS